MLGLKEVLKPFGSQGFLVGVGVSCLAYLLAPQIKDNLRPAAVKGAQGLMALGNETKRLFSEGKEKITRAFEKNESPSRGNNEIAALIQEMRDERTMSLRMMEELKNSVIGLREEISHLRSNQNIQQG